MVKFGFRCHCGGLEESLKSKKYITLERFNKLLPEYEFYAFDERCDQYLFILKDMVNKFNCFKTKNYKDYLRRSWLFIEVS